LELPAYQPETNPGYCWAIAGGHVSMGTYGILAREGIKDIDSWVNAITQDKLHVVGFNLIGLCLFFDIGHGIATQMIVDCLESEFGLNVSIDSIRDTVRRSFIHAMALEFHQGYTKDEYCLPAEVAKKPNPNINLPNLAKPEFMTELTKKVWAVFDPEVEQALSCFPKR